MLLGVAGGLIVLLVGAGSVAVVSSDEAGRQRDSATIEALVGTALALRSSERDVSALLAAEAFRRWPDDPRTRSGLMGVLQGAGGFLGNAVLAQSGNAYGSLIPGTEEMLVVMADGEAAVRDAETGGVVQDLDIGFQPGLDEPRPLVEVSGDGRVGAMLWPVKTQPAGVTWYGTSPQSDLVAFDLVRGERIFGPAAIAAAGAGALAVNADGSIIAVADARDGSVTLVTSPGGAMREIADDHPVALERDSMAAALAFDRGGRLVVGRLDDRVDLIDPASATISASFPVPDSSAHVAIAFGEASGIAVASGDRGLVAFEPDDGHVRWSTPIGRPYTRPCNGLAVSERMQRAYCGTPFGRIEVFDLADGAPLGEEELGPLYGAVGPIDIDSDGMELTTLSGTHPIISRWRLDENGLGRRLVAPGRMLAGPYSYDGASILVAPQAVIPLSNWVVEGTTVMDLATGDDTYRFDEPVMNAGWASEGRLFAQSADDKVTRLVDASSGEQVGKAQWGLWALWPSTDGTTLYAVRRDGRIQDVDPQTGQRGGRFVALGRVPGLDLRFARRRPPRHHTLDRWNGRGYRGRVGER